MSESRKRIWTEESVQQWTTQRNDYVQRKTGRTLDEIRASEDPKDKKLLKSIDTGEKDTLYERAHIFGTVTLAWEVRNFCLYTNCIPLSYALEHDSHHGCSAPEASYQFVPGTDLRNHTSTSQSSPNAWCDHGE